MTPTLKQKLLCTGCAAVLAAGLVPAAAWGGNTPEEQPAQTFTETVADAGQPTDEGNIPEDDTSNEKASGTETPKTENPVDEEDDNGNSDQPEGDKTDGNGAESGGEGDGTPATDDDANKTTTPETTDDKKVDSEEPAAEPAATEGYLTEDEGADADSTEADEEEGTTDEPAETTYDEVRFSGADAVTMYPTFGYGLFDDNIFSLNEEGYNFFMEHPFDDYLTSLTSSDPSVVKVVKDDDDDPLFGGYHFEALKAGTATLTLSLKDKDPVSCQVTVKAISSIDYSQLKFTQKNLNMKVGENLWTNFFIDDYVSCPGLEEVQGLIVLGSSDYSIVDTYASDGAMVVALKPGIVKLGLYFYNPETDEHTLTDTMTVTVGAPTVLVNSSASSDISGGIVSSNEHTDLMISGEGVTLNINVKREDQLSAAQKNALVMVKDATGYSKAVPVEITLVNRWGHTISENENNYSYTVRMKLEGELAQFDPESIVVFYLGDDGAPVYVTSWVEGGYLYLTTDHFSQYVVTGDAAGDQAQNTPATTTPVANTGTSDTKKQTVTATATTTLPQAGDDATALAPAVALTGAAAVAALYLARRRKSDC